MSKVKDFDFDSPEFKRRFAAIEARDAKARKERDEAVRALWKHNRVVGTCDILRKSGACGGSVVAQPIARQWDGMVGCSGHERPSPPIGYSYSREKCGVSFARFDDKAARESASTS